MVKRFDIWEPSSNSNAADCVNRSIDAQKVFGHALYKDGKDTKAVLSLGAI